MHEPRQPEDHERGESRGNAPDPAPDPAPELTPDDQRMLDLLAQSGFDRSALEGMPAADRARGERVLALLDLLNDYPVDDGFVEVGDEMLVHATLARIDRVEEDCSARMSFDLQADKATTRRRIRLPDFVTIAAMILILAGIFGPIGAQMHKKSIDTRCENNLRQVGYAFANYAAANNNAMPVALAGPQYTWDTLTNVVNLGPLLAGGYCEHDHLQCPGVHDTSSAASYSYQWQLPNVRPTWAGGPGMTLVLGDRNPLIDAARSGESAPALTVSTSHGGRGQNVLRNDGSSMWLDQPIVGGADNIWLPNGQDELRFGAQPVDRADVFLAH